MILAFTVPGSPRGKGRARSTRAGHHYTPKATAAYENLIKLACRDAMRVHRVKMFSGPVALEVQACMPIPVSWSAKRQAAAFERPHINKPDLDNIIKALLDGLNGVAFLDDREVSRIAIHKLYSTHPCLVVSVGPDIDVFT